MKKKIIWLVASCSIVVALLLASCGPAVTEEEGEEATALPAAEQEVVTEEEEAAPPEEEVVTEEEEAASPTPTPTDTTPPSIANVLASDIADTTATLTWTTDEPASSKVEYGKTEECESSSPLDGTIVTTHSVTLSGLEPNTIYHFRIKSQDEAGNEALSDDYTFTTKTTEELLSAILYYPPTTVGGITTADGEVVVPKSYMLRFELFNGSSQTITVTKVEIVDGHRRVQVSFSITPDTVDAGKSCPLAHVVETLPSEDWQVKWHCLDAKGVEFTIIGACSSSD